MTYHTRQAFFIEYLDNLDSNGTLKLRAEMDLSIIFLCGTIQNTLICVRKPFIFFYRESTFPLDFLFCYFLSFLSRVRVLRRVFGMEPSTSGENIRQKYQRKSLYDQRQVLKATKSSMKGNINPIQNVPPFLSNFLSDLCNSQSPKKTLSRKG